MPSLKKSLFLFLIPCLFCGCFQKSFGTEHSHYELGISLRVPENWQRADISSAAALSSMVFKDDQGGTIILTQNFETGFKKQLKITSKKNYPILEKGPLLFSKYKTEWLRSVEGRISNITYVIKADDDRTFSVICTAPSLNFASYRANFDLIAKAFRIF